MAQAKNALTASGAVARAHAVRRTTTAWRAWEASLTQHRRISPPAPGSGPPRGARERAHLRQQHTKTKTGLPPSAGFWNVARYDRAERLRELVVGSSRGLPVRAHSVKIKEKQVPLDHHVQLPECVPGASPEKRLQRKHAISANALRLDGGSLGVDASRTVGVRKRENFGVQMRVADLSCAGTMMQNYTNYVLTKKQKNKHRPSRTRPL